MSISLPSFSLKFPIKLSLFVLLATLAGTTTGCGTGGGGTSSGGGGGEQFVLKGNVSNCIGDSMRLFRVVGPNRERLAAGKIERVEGKMSFELKATLQGSGFYAIGPDAGNSAMVILGDAPEATVSGNCQNAQQNFKLTGSAMNDEYQTFLQRVIQHNKKVQQLSQNLQVFSRSDPNQVPRIQQEMQTENTAYFAYLDEIEQRPDFMGKVAKFYNFKPFGSDPSHSKYASEVEYFVGEFFTGLDLNDPAVAAAPQLFEKAQAFGSNVPSIFPEQQAKKHLDETLSKATAGSVAHASILKGYLIGMEQRKSDLYIPYGEAFVAQYGSDPMARQVQGALDRMKALAVGQPAPDISAATPEGGELKLSSLKGQYVLIDFWASWCRPCRMENPNVVKAYQKYHKAGFEILGVSLDKDQGKWVQAIAADGLPWKHISDLRGWSSQPAGVYGVSSIPATVLVDKDGLIVAKGLRGPALESKLGEIFGF